MPGIRTNAAAEVLGVSPNTLRSWERRYGFPTPKRTPGNHRNYELVELQTLRDADWINIQVARSADLIHWEHLGDALFKSGRRYEARFAWNAALISAEDDIATRVKAKLASGLTPANAAP